MENEKVAKQLLALGNPTRLAVFRQLVRVGPKGTPVGAIQKSLNLAGSTLTNHLQRLVAAGLAHQERNSTELICSANFAAMRKIIGFLQEECCADACDNE